MFSFFLGIHYEYVPEYTDEVYLIEEDSENDSTHHLKENSGPPNLEKRGSKRGRKLKYDCNRQEKIYRKYHNLPYTTENKVVKSKIFNDYGCICKRNCSDKVPKAIREQEFNKFVRLGSYKAQLYYILNNVNEVRKKRSYTSKTGVGESKRVFSRIYKLNGTQVCKDMFCRTLQITSQKITLSLKKARNGNELRDERGRTSGGWNKLPEEHFNFILNVISGRPKSEVDKNTYESNRTPELSVRKLYQIYKNKFEKKYGTEAKCASLATFKNIFAKKKQNS